jgi:hypothetical protein
MLLCLLLATAHITIPPPPSKLCSDLCAANCSAYKLNSIGLCELLDAHDQYDPSYSWKSIALPSSPCQKNTCVYCQQSNFGPDWGKNFNGSHTIYFSADCAFPAQGSLDLSNIPSTNYSISNIAVDATNSTITAHCPLFNIGSSVTISNLNIICLSGSAAFIITGKTATFNNINVLNSPDLTAAIDSRTHLNNLPVDIELITINNVFIDYRPVATFTRVAAAVKCQFRSAFDISPPYIIIAASPLTTILPPTLPHVLPCPTIITAQFGNFVGTDYEIQYFNKNAFTDYFKKDQITTISFLAFITAVLIAVIAAKFDATTALFHISTQK